jgi:uncharacterized membrane-anchored protein
MHQDADFAVGRGMSADDEPDGGMGKLLLEALDFVSGGILRIGYAEEDFEFGVVLLDLGDEGFVSIRIEAAKGFQDGDSVDMSACATFAEMAEGGEDGEALIKEGG